MSLEVPTQTDLSSYTQRTELDGTDYVLLFQFNQRLGRWFVDVFDQDESPIAQGIRLVTNFPLATFIRDERKFPGVIQVVDQEGSSEAPQDALNQATRDAGLVDLGDRFLLIYFEEAEVAALV